MPAYIIAHDIGTTNHKCTVFNDEGEVVSSAARAYPTFYQKGGIAEQDPSDWWRNFCETTVQVLKDINPREIAGISFSAHMNGCLPVDSDGKPLMRSMIHADTRSSEIESEIYSKISEDQLYGITGNRLESRYPLLKMYWMKKENPEMYSKAKYFLQAKDYLAFRLTGNLGVTDYSDASLTGAFNLETRDWEASIFKETGLDLTKMPTPVPSTEVIGYVQKSTALVTGLVEGTPVIIGGGDGACATVGAGCLAKDETYLSLGTTAWVSKVADKPFIDPDKRVFTICDLNPKYYNVLGTMQTAGSAYEWAIKQLSSITDWETVSVEPEYSDFETQLKTVPAGSRGVIFHPYLLGERSPIWNDKARGSFFGLSLEHNRFDIAKSVLEGIAFSLASISEIINNAGSKREIRMIGGLAKSGTFIQIISDVLNLPVRLTENASEATSIGAAIAGGVGVGMFPSFEDAASLIHTGNIYEPNQQHTEIYAEQLERFKVLYDRIKDIPFYT
ncbi:xylulokinase [Peribacillus glennii]|uniref:Xylulokinase n=1 Tax=Peribacillus glennii TaxID=2303991 RepID=A0A372L8T0_9BACI|nr:FGGY-family carbohydrate kinase [Peribacillus glennii]RFU61807.1 xylulokinase [Peribacillus glennii]